MVENRRARMPRGRKLLASAAAVLALVGVSVVVPAATPAYAAQTVFESESFMNATLGTPANWKKLGTNDACLTAAASATLVPVPGCALPTPDTNGQGALRLTAAQASRTGAVGSTRAFPVSNGLDISFTSYQYGGNRADGIAFYLAAADPLNPQVPNAMGAVGGSLGYSGMSNGYLGVGLDAYGNFMAQESVRTGCGTAPGRSAGVTVHGPGNNGAGYCILSHQEHADTTLSGGSRAAGTAAVPVRFMYNPSATAVTADATDAFPSAQVPARSYVVLYKLRTETTVRRAEGALPVYTGANASFVPAGWLDDNGYPLKLTYGWTASTGGSNDIHEISTVRTASLSGVVPAISSAPSGSSSVVTGSTGTYSTATTVGSSGGTAGESIQVKTTFPTGFTPTGAGTGTGWSCTLAASVSTCSYDVGAGVAPGTTLPTITYPYAVSGDGGVTRTISTETTSASSLPTTTTRAVAVQKAATTTAATVGGATTSSVAYGVAPALAASGLPTDATGTVEFSYLDGSGTKRVLCTAPVANGAASCAGPAGLAAGSYSITAAYSGNGRYTASSATPVQLTVTKASASSLTTGATGPVSYGNAVPLQLAGIPAGAAGDSAVTFEVRGADNTVVKTVTTTVAELGSATTGVLPVAGYTVVGTWAGDANHIGSAGAAASFTVTKVATSLTGSGTDTVYRESRVALSFAGLPEGATGSVQFVRNGTVLCTIADITAASECRLALTRAAGENTGVTARYSGDASHAPSTSAPFGFVIAQAVPSNVGANVQDTTYGTAPVIDKTSVVLPQGAADAAIVTMFARAAGDADAELIELCTTTIAQAKAGNGDPCSFLPSTLEAGTYDVLASYNGDADPNYLSAPATLIDDTFTVAQLPTAVAAEGDSVAYGTAGTVTASGLPKGATGTVTFTYTDAAGDQQSQTVEVGDPLTFDTAATLPVGDYVVTAAYSGDRNHAASSTTATVTVTKATTDLIVEQPEAAVFGEPGTLQAGNLPPAGATGTLTFRYTDDEGVVVLCEVDLASPTCETPTNLDAGDYRVTVEYSGDANHAGSTSEPVTFTVQKATPNVDASAPEAPTYGEPITVALGEGFPADATGTVTITDAAGKELCTFDLADARSCTLPDALPVVDGGHTLTVTYGGDKNYEKDATTVSVFPTQAETAVSLTVKDGVYGTPVTLTAGDLPSAATGTVTFVTTDAAGDEFVLCTATLPALTCDTEVDLPAGTYEVVAKYSGDTNHAPSTGAPLTLTVTAQASVLAVQVEETDPVWGSTVHLTATGLPEKADGTITFFDGARELCSVTLPKLSCGTDLLKPGTHTVTAVYSGDGNHAETEASTETSVAIIKTAVDAPKRAERPDAVTATWPATPGAAGYRVIVSTSPDFSNPIEGWNGREVGGVTEIVVDGLDPDTRYYYLVVGVDEEGAVLSEHVASVETAAAEVVEPPVTEPVDPTEPPVVDPTDPEVPSEPTDPAVPTEPTVPAEPTDPVVPAEPADPAAPSVPETEPAAETPATVTPVDDAPTAEEPEPAGLAVTGAAGAPLALLTALMLAALGGVLLIARRRRGAANDA